MCQSNNQRHIFLVAISCCCYCCCCCFNVCIFFRFFTSFHLIWLRECSNKRMCLLCVRRTNNGQLSVLFLVAMQLWMHAVMIYWCAFEVRIFPKRSSTVLDILSIAFFNLRDDNGQGQYTVRFINILNRYDSHFSFLLCVWIFFFFKCCAYVICIQCALKEAMSQHPSDDNSQSNMSEIKRKKNTRRLLTGFTSLLH